APQCEGTAVQISGTVTNGSGSPEHVFVKVGASGTEVDLGSLWSGERGVGPVAAGNLTCVGGGEDFTVFVRAIGDCKPEATDNKPLRVTCLTSPKVSLALTPVAPQCEGTAVAISGTVTNGGTVAEEIFVKIGASGTEVDLGSL